MILGREEILRRLRNGEIFRKDTWDKKCLREASYVLRIADDGLLLDGKFYDPYVPRNRGRNSYIEIEPGKIAILSTQEELNMPSDLVGKIGVRLEFAHLGLTGLMGIQVDPLFGHDKEKERLYIRVANFGNNPIRLSAGDGVFTFELHEVAGPVPVKSKEASWPRIKRSLKDIGNASWSYVTRVEEDLSEQTSNIREYLQPLVLFRVFLVAVTILGVSLSVILTLRNLESPPVPEWVTDWGWALLLGTLSFGTFGTACVGLASAFRLFRPYRFKRHAPTVSSRRKQCKGLLANPFKKQP